MVIELGQKPQVFLGSTYSRELLEQMRQLGWGRLFCRDAPRPLAGESWGLDNGAFSAWRRQVPWDSEQFLYRVEKAFNCCHRPLLAIAPDIVMGGTQSLEFSLAWMDKLPEEFPWYLAVQDGMEPNNVRWALTQFAGLFLGGSNKFKSTANQWCALAHEQGKKFHYGRAGIVRRVDHACSIGADSLDSAFPLWSSTRFCEFVRYWRDGSPQLQLLLECDP